MIVCIILAVAALIFLVVAIYLSKHTHEINREIDEINFKNQRKKEELEQEVKDLEKILNLCTKNVEQSRLSFENYCNTLDIYYGIKENEFDAKIRALALEFEQKKENHS